MTSYLRMTRGLDIGIEWVKIRTVSCRTIEVPMALIKEANRLVPFALKRRYATSSTRTAVIPEATIDANKNDAKVKTNLVPVKGLVF